MALEIRHASNAKSMTSLPCIAKFIDVNENLFVKNLFVSVNIIFLCKEGAF
jgi:hypothetical protein